MTPRCHSATFSRKDLESTPAPFDLQMGSHTTFAALFPTSTAQDQVRKEIVANLNNAKSSIRHNLGKRIEMRRVPEIIFKDDVVLDKGLSVLKLLDELKNKTQDNNAEDKDANS